jgi:hypothetical protein
MALTQERRKYYDELEETLDTVGWKKHIMEDVFQQYEGAQESIAHADLNNDQIRQIRGAMAVLKSLLDYAQIVDLSRAHEEEESEELEEQDVA